MKKQKFIETHKLEQINKKQKKSYKKLFFTIVLLIISLAGIIALAIGINIAKNGVH